MLKEQGHEFASLVAREDVWELSGTVIFVHEGHPTRIDYLVICDSSWSTRSVNVSGMMGSERFTIDLEVDSDQSWKRNGVAQAEVFGCVDVDLGFSPSTNILPIRRLALDVDEKAEIKVAWLQFPSFELKSLTQVYHREGGNIYRYESGGGAFKSVLAVDDIGFVIDYPGLWRAESAT
ncbi:putative glycolipid-binding domain-containing protein [Natronospira bacteriovora]|uniref:Glycolipid-binding domain-containing protein n=1 Tax=Natronospira bacteriovora TaxID=3069753 RepID=A0ABU0W450_9GAMM|nr:putative glycolipid-binding domain-containing protein [Natronospira sp. AB-CW4]MDQ2068799.1 putative glycolipid-binding domain-containing protein [Natronospira sp. AB-CW4]